MKSKIVLLLTAICAFGISASVASADAGGNSVNAKLCQKNGWQNLYTSTGATFAGQDACVAYAAQGGQLLTTPPVTSAQACAALSGTFVEPGASGAIWTCTFPVASLSDELAKIQTLTAPCAADGGGTLDSIPTNPLTTVATSCYPGP